MVNAERANGPAHTVFVDKSGEEVEPTPALQKLFDNTQLATAGGVSGLAPITISPDTNILTLNPGQVLNETLTVTIPKSQGTAKADVYSSPTPLAQ